MWHIICSSSHGICVHMATSLTLQLLILAGFSQQCTTGTIQLLFISGPLDHPCDTTTQTLPHSPLITWPGALLTMEAKSLRTTKIKFHTDTGVRSDRPHGCITMLWSKTSIPLNLSDESTAHSATHWRSSNVRPGDLTLLSPFWPFFFVAPHVKVH